MHLRQHDHALLFRMHVPDPRCSPEEEGEPRKDDKFNFFKKVFLVVIASVLFFFLRLRSLCSVVYFEDTGPGRIKCIPV